MNFDNRRPDLISVVIPTYRRPVAVQAAVLSALDQTWPEVEVIVVSDGPDQATRDALAGMSTRLRYLELGTNQGPAAARNAGVEASRGEWLAFLDDDDTMLPERLERQMQLADREQPKIMISCRMWYRHEQRLDLWPKQPLADSQELADYLLVRPSLLGRPGVISIQSLLVHRSVVQSVPFTSHADHEDWAWLLEAWHRFGARIAFLWEPLVVYNIDTSNASRSRRLNWEDSLAWADDHRPYMSARAYSSFLSTKVALKAKRAGDWRGLGLLARRVLRSRPRPIDLVFLAGITMLPGPLLQGAWKRSLRSSSAADLAVADAI